MDKQIEVYLHSGILHSNKKEKPTTHTNNMDAFQNYSAE